MSTADPVITKSILESALNTVVENITGVIRELAADNSRRFENIDRRFDAVDRRFDKIESEISGLNAKYDQLLGTMDHFLKRIDTYETENSARDAHLARLGKLT